MTEAALIALTAIGLAALVSQVLSWWLKLPAILFLLVAGFVAGPVTGWLDPDRLFGDLLFPFVSLAVAVVLFEGGLTLRLDEIRGLERVVRRMVSTGLVLSWAVIAGAAAWFMHWPLPLAVLFGAMAVVTGPTVIVPMLRTVRPKPRLANVLRWEGIVIDPLGALLSVLVFEFIVARHAQAAIGHTLVTFAGMVITGLALGVAVAQVLGVALRRHWLPEFLHDVATLLLVFAVFTSANLLMPESGLLAVTVMGMWLANLPEVHTDDILDFKESLSLLLISGLFIILAARLEPSDVAAMGWPAIGVLAVVQFVARPLKVAVSTWGSSLDLRERALLAWIAPRGIVAAAVAALFALKLESEGYSNARDLVPLTFLVIVGTVVLQSATARWLAKALGVAEPEASGFLVVGAHPLARAIAGALAERDIPVLLADTNADNVRQARVDGLPVYFGNVVSRHADRKLSLVSLGSLLALSPRREENTAAALRYRGEFGSPAIYSLPSPAERSDREEDTEQRIHKPVVGNVAFGRNATCERLSALMRDGARIRTTRLGEDFSFEDYKATHGDKAIPLFAISPAGRVSVFTPDPGFEPSVDWVIIALVANDSETQ